MQLPTLTTGNMRLQFIFFFFLILGYSPFFAQNTRFESLTIKDGLSQGMVFDILQTRDGFLWVATKDGLNRYDGYNFKHYSNDPFNPYSLGENTVTALFEDTRGLLWVGTENRGVDIYDPVTERFHHIPMNCDSCETMIAAGPGVRTIREGEDGSIWVMKLGVGLIRIEVPSSWGQNLSALPENAVSALKPTPFPVPLQSAPTKEFLLDFSLKSANNIMVSSNLAVYALELEGGTQVTKKYPDLVSGDAFKIILGAENQGGLWSINARELRRLRNGKLDRFPRNIVGRFSLQEGHQGHVWVMINEKLWDLAPGESFQINKPDYTLDRTISCVRHDRAGNLWVGTMGYGLRKINPTQMQFHHGAVGKSIVGVWRSVQGQYYVKIQPNIYAFNPESGEIDAAPVFKGLSDKETLSLAFDKKGQIWAISRLKEDKGGCSLNLCDARGTVVKSYRFEGKLSVDACCFFTADGNLWIGAKNCLLLRFDPANEQFTAFDLSNLFGKSAFEVRMKAFAEDANGTLWIGTQLGLVKIQRNGSDLTRQLIQAKPSDNTGLNNNSIAFLLVDPALPAKRLWIGTKGGGINIMDLETGKCRHVNKRTHPAFPNDVVYAILPGENADFWCTTNNGIFRMIPKGDPGSEHFDIKVFTAIMGLQDDEFNTQAWFKAHDGELLFGGVNGLNRFYPKDLMTARGAAALKIIGLEINHKKVDWPISGEQDTQSIQFTRTISLTHDQNNISIAFALLDFSAPAQNRYRYRLDGIDQDWVECGADHFAHFTHLKPGKYVFYVEGNNGQGDWIPAAFPLVLHVSPPWYRSGFAYLIYLMLFAIMLWNGYRAQIRRIRLKQALLFEQRESERIKALEQAKVNFFNNVTHEFRTPLTLILEPVRQILENTEDSRVRENAVHIEKSGKKLLEMVNQLLDLAKLESGSMTLDLKTGDLNTLLQRTLQAFLPLANQRKIKLAYYVEQEPPLLNFDSYKVEIILNNLLSNALKFTAAGGAVRVLLSLKTLDSKSYACVAVQDNGPGIATENLDKIFSRFYQITPGANPQGGGTGIGLALCKEMAQLMEAKLTVQSAPGQGTCFEFYLPLNATTALKETLQINPDYPEEATDSRPDGANPTVLLVEDNEDMRRFVRQALKNNWFIYEAADGVEGLKMATELIPDLIITDLMLPEKDGFSLCADLKQQAITAHIPIILLTGKSDPKDRIKGFELGADDYLQKPFSTQELDARMSNLIEQRKKLRALFSGSDLLPMLESKNNEANALSEPDREFLNRLTLTLEQHLDDETLSVESLARKMFVSRMQLLRKLKALVGQSPADFIRNYRLERAMNLLKSKDGNVSQVAAKVGFGNEKYFSTVFKERFGLSPSEV